jgi:ATPase family associated with various cellular activities (AAA)
MSELLHALVRLDALLAEGVARAEAEYGRASDPFRGLRIDLAEVERLLARRPGEPILSVGDAKHAGSASLDWLATEAELSPFDVDVVLVALAPEVDLRYERLYAYLQDDVTRKRPTVDLVLNLLCATPEERLEARDRFASSAPLVGGRIVRLVPPPDQPAPPRIAHAVKLEEQIVGALLGNLGLAEPLAGFCRIVEPAVTLDELLLTDELRGLLTRLIARCVYGKDPLRVYLRGLAGSGRHRAAEALASASGRALLSADVARAPTGEAFADAVNILLREAHLRGALLYVHGIDALRRNGDATVAELQRVLAVHSGPAILAGSEPWEPSPPSGGREPLGVVELPVGIPETALRREAWASELARRGIEIDEHDLHAIAARFRLTFGQIVEAAALAAARGALAPRRPRSQRVHDIFAAARDQTGYDLGKFAVKVAPVYGWHDIVLGDDVRDQLVEIRMRVAHRDRVLDEWGFDRKLSHGKGVTALFAGPPGTGKTMAAEIIGRDLGLDLYTIDLSGVVSKWIGETEKNLDRIFQAAEHGNAVLCFHEADAIFGKRSEVSDAHDRYANIEISYLLQKMETYDGLAVLTTNLPENIDEAFVRRLTFIVHFAFPETAERRAIWERAWPVETPLDDDLDLDALASAFRLSGGNIKNAALAAAFLAAEDGSPIGMEHVLHAIRREFGKLGTALSEEELVVRAGEGR